MKLNRTKSKGIKYKIILHHIDGDKKNDRLSNLVIMLTNNHGIITSAQQHYDRLAEFFEEILKKNLKSIENEIVPKSWKIGWRPLAIKSGIILHHNRYKRRGRLNKKLVTMKNRIKDIKKWV